MPRTLVLLALLLGPSVAQADGRPFPTGIDPEARYLFYLHGKIIEDQGLPAVSPRFGEYRYGEILAAFEARGFRVISEIRQQGADALAHAERLAVQVGELLAAGVPASRITVLGASKGAFIAAAVSRLRPEPELRYVLLATCHPGTLRYMLEEGWTLNGRVLTLRDRVDEMAGSCDELLSSAGDRGPTAHREIVLEVGTGHGILYQPLPEWLEPALAWVLAEP